MQIRTIFISVDSLLKLAPLKFILFFNQPKFSSSGGFRKKLLTKIYYQSAWRARCFASSIIFNTNRNASLTAFSDYVVLTPFYGWAFGSSTDSPSAMAAALSSLSAERKESGGIPLTIQSA